MGNAAWVWGWFLGLDLWSQKVCVLSSASCAAHLFQQKETNTMRSGHLRGPDPANIGTPTLPQHTPVGIRGHVGHALSSPVRSYTL